MTNKYYGYWIEQTKMWNSLGNSISQHYGFKTKEEALKALQSHHDKISFSDDYFVGDYDIFEYDPDKNSEHYSQIFNLDES